MKVIKRRFLASSLFSNWARASPSHPTFVTGRRNNLPCLCCNNNAVQQSRRAKSPELRRHRPDNFVCQEVSGLSHPQTPTILNEGIPIKKGLPGWSPVCDKEVQGACLCGGSASERRRIDVGGNYASRRATPCHCVNRLKPLLHLAPP